jgi:hypothetical protein
MVDAHLHDATAIAALEQGNAPTPPWIRPDHPPANQAVSGRSTLTDLRAEVRTPRAGGA